MENREMLKRSEEIINLINSWEYDDFKSYKASPLLKELIQLNENLLASEIQDNKEALKRIFKYFLFIGDTYKRMVRCSLAAKNHERALDVAIRLHSEHKEKSFDIQKLFNDILKERNFYVDDDCLDVFEKVKNAQLIDQESMEKIYKQAMGHRRTFKNDPIEMSEEYLAVIDEVEEKIDKNRTMDGMGSCHEIWGLKSEYLAEKGIYWRSPHLLNPRIMFD